MNRNNHLNSVKHRFARYINITVVLFLVTALLFVPFTSSAYESIGTENGWFLDVSENSPAYEALLVLRQKGIIPSSEGNRFRPSAYLKKGDFMVYLCKLMGWDEVNPSKNTFSDVKKGNKYFPFIEAAVSHNVISPKSKYFRPNAYITKAEIAEMLVRAMGYERLAEKAATYGVPFTDLGAEAGYAMFMVDTGIMEPESSTLFGTNDRVKREEAAIILFNVYRKLDKSIRELHAFYAIDSSSQMDYIKDLDSVSFGWSRLQYDKNSKSVFLNTTYSNNNEYAVPLSFSKPVALAKENGVSVLLNVIATQEEKVYDSKNNEDIGLVEYVISNPNVREKVISDITKQVLSTQRGNEKVSFDGVVIDFEGLRGEEQKNNFTLFLKEMKNALDPYKKKLYVAVHPARYGQSYYDGYDYRAIGEIADKVILMAHDYDAKSLTYQEMDRGYTYTPLTPIDEIYYALKAITDSQTGVKDTGKVWLQINFATAQWQVRDKKVINKTPYNPYYYQLKNRILNEETKDTLTIEFDEKSQNPYITYTDKISGIQNRIWYEDARSVLAKISVASLFDVKGISIWRLGNIPDYEDEQEIKMHLNVWQEIIILAGK